MKRTVTAQLALHTFAMRTAAMKHLGTNRLVGAIAAALIAPPAVTYLLSSLIAQEGLNVFSVLFIEAVAFGSAIVLLRPRVSSAVVTAVLYFPFMFVVIFWIGYRAGYYDFP